MLQRYLAYLQLDRRFVLLVFVLSYLMVISTRVQAGLISWYTLTPEGPLAQFIAAMLIFTLMRFWINRQSISDTKPRWQQYSMIGVLSLLLYLLLTNTLSLVVALLFNTVQRNFNGPSLLANNFTNVINVVFYGGIYLAYYHYQQLARYREQLELYNQQLAQAKIQQLKAQINPHFVFNSLNTLDELIAVDPAQASEYLQHFADLYRLSLKSADQQLINVQDEISFSQHYFKLMQVRLGEGYQLQFNAPSSPVNAQVPPFTLQVLLENVFLHNNASAAAPLQVQLTLTADSLSVSHRRQPKSTPTDGNGIGLKNLARQLQFLTGRPLQIHASEQQFSVTVPLFLEENSCIRL